MIHSKLNIIQLRIILICGKFDDSGQISTKFMINGRTSILRS
jgi:hypothetical protein